MLGLSSSLSSGAAALKSIVKSGLQLFYKADRTQAPLGEEQVLNNSFDELGAELVSDADFTTDSFWTKETNITILGGKAVFNTGSDNFGLVRSNLTTDGKTYKAQLEITDYTSGAVQFNYNGVYIGSFNTVGTHTAYFVAGGNNGFGIQSDVAADLSLGSASLKQVDPNDRWITQNPDTSAHTAEIREGEAYINYDHDAGTQNSTGIKQTGIFPNTTSKYEIKVGLGEVTGTLKLQTRGINTTINSSNSNTTKVILLDSSSDSQDLIFIGRTSNTISGSAFVKNVSVKEITNSIKDHSKNSNDGTLYSGKALDFDGTGDAVTVGDTEINMKTVAFWIFVADVTSNTEQIMEFKSDHGISSVNGTITTAGTFANKVIYVNGSSGTSINASTWSRIVITTTTAIDVNQLVFGTDGSSSGTFVIADFQLYDKAWNATDVKYDWENPDKDVFDRVGEAQVLDEELVSNGDFSNSGVGDFTAIEGGLERVSNELILTTTTTADNQINYNIPLVVGKTYKATLLFNEVGSSTNKWALYSGVYLNGTNNREVQTYGVHTVTFVATNTALSIQTYGAGAIATYSFDNISVKEVTTHASHILPTDCKSLLRLNEGAGDRVYDAAPVLGAEEVQNGTFELGSELSVNGDFINTLSPNTVEGASGTSNITWDSQAGGSAKLIYNSNDNTSLFLKIPAIIENGKNYYISIDATTITNGSKFKILGNDDQELKINIGNGTTNFSFVAQYSVDNIRIYRQDANQNSQLYINSFTIKELPNWVLRNNTTIVDGVANVIANGSIGSTTYNWSLESITNVFETSKTYRIKFRAKQVSLAGSNAGTFQVGNSYGALFDEVITSEFVDYTFTAQTSSNYWPKLTIGGRTAGDVFQIDDISVKEIKPAESFAIVGTKAFIHQQPYIPQYAMSSFSKKILFDGSNDYVACGSDASIDNIFTGGGTISCWVSPETDGGADIGNIISKSDGDDEGWVLRVSNDDNNQVGLAFIIESSTTDGTWVFGGNDLFSLNKITHISLTYNSSSLSNTPKVYINGIEKSTSSATQPVGTISSDANKNLIIGDAGAGFNKNFDGIIDEVSMFKIILTQAEVLELYNSGSSFDSTGHSKYNLGEEVSNGTLDLGSEEVVDGDFSSSVNWAESGDQWVINNNTATYTGDNTANELLQEISFIGGRTYQIKIDVASISGTLKVRFNNEEVNKVAFNQTGIQTLYITASGSGNITDDLSISRETGTVSAVLNSVSVKEIPSWSFANGWGVSNNTATYDGTGAQYAKFVQPLAVVAGRTYQVAFTLNDLSGSSVKIGLATSGNTFLTGSAQFTANGTHTIIMTATASDNRIVLQANSATMTFNVSNVSVQEYGVSGYWRNNGADQWDDLSINSNHGTVSGSPTEIFLQEVPFFGKDSLGMFMNKPRLGGLNFNGSGYVANQGMPTISDNISFSFWIKLEDFVANNLAQVVGKRTGTDSAWCRVYRPSADTLRLEVTGSHKLDFTIPEAEWVHVVTTIDDRAVKAYVNGALISQATLGVDFNFLSANDFSIGAWKNTANSVSSTSLLNGVVDDVMVYDETLTSKQVKKNYNATKGKHKN